ncbi:MAG: hypothetical protein U1A16_01795, partial [Patescibacteria group bacterium]|nr:hypothetical protein [Patescibacteria group bacterium]
GRDTFWIPPHLLLYVSVLALVGIAGYAWHKSKSSAWKRFLAFLLLIPLAAPLDELWHRLLGKEAIESPLIIWSPPHLLLIGGLLGSLAALIIILKSDRASGARQFFESLAFGTLLGAGFLFLVPTFPTGPYELLGFWGAGITAALLMGVLFLAQILTPGTGEATSAVIVFFVLLAIGPFFERQVAPGINIPVYTYPPLWIVAAGLLLPALFLDIVRRPSFVLRGAVAGLLYASMLFGVALFFLPSEFRYPWDAAIQALVSSVLGGAAAGKVLQLFYRRNLPERY